VLAGAGGGSRNADGSTPTLLVTIGVAPAAAADAPSSRLPGSVPTELVTIGGVGAAGAAVAAVAGDAEAAGGAGGVTFRLSFTIGTCTVRVTACRWCRLTTVAG